MVAGDRGVTLEPGPVILIDTRTQREDRQDMTQIDPRRGVASVAPALVLAAMAAAGTAACGADEAPRFADVAPPPAITLLPSPAPPNSAEPNLTAGPDGIYLTWLERRGGDLHALRYARWDGGSWSAPGQVMERSGLFVNWADFPAMVVLDDGTMAAHWLERSGPRSYDYDVRLAISRDGGTRWSDDVVPHHRSGVHAEHGFVSLFPAAGDIGVVWLDGRETVHGDPMTLRFTTVTAGGATSDEVVLDGSVCDCCQTSVARTTDGLVVAYRGRSGDEVRDILTTRQVDGAWTEPRTVHDDGWVIPGCPVNGPAIAADGRRVVVAWFTGAPPGDRVLAAVSDDGGATFGTPVRIDEGQGMGRVGVVMLDDGEALVMWLERAEDGAEIRTRRIHGDRVGPATALAATVAARAAGFPHVARWGDRLVFAWTEAGETPMVRTATATIGRGAGSVARGDH
jgi:hypothetical protein